MLKRNKWSYLTTMLGGMVAMLVFYPAMAAAEGFKSENVVAEDFYLTRHYGIYDTVSEIELFTKQTTQNAFFGVACSEQSPFPSIQILLQGQSSWLRANTALKVEYRIKGVEKKDLIPVSANLRVIESSSGVENQIRLRIDTQGAKTMTTLVEQYRLWMNQLKAGSDVAFTLSTIGDDNLSRQYAFSLKGLSILIKPDEAICF